MKEHDLARIDISAPRRWVAIAMLAALAGILLWVGLAHPPADLALRAFVVLFGGLVLFAADRMHRGTRSGLVLTRAGLCDGDGQVLARLDDIEKIDRGALAFKPTNGFVLKLAQRQPRRWVPGLWWCTGRRLGVGGVTIGPQTRMMAEILQTRIAARDQPR